MSAASRSLWADADVLEHLMPDVVAGDECDPWSSMASRAAEVEPGTGHTPTGVFVAQCGARAENERMGVTVTDAPCPTGRPTNIRAVPKVALPELECVDLLDEVAAVQE